VITRHFGSLEFVDMLGVLFVALLAEAKIVTCQAIEPILASFDSLEAAITSKPAFKSFSYLSIVNLPLD